MTQRRNDNAPHAGCAGKKSYWDKGSAIKAMLRVKARQPKGIRTEVYYCGFCGKFHWGQTGGDRP